MVSFSSAYLFPARKREAVTYSGTMRIDNTTRRRTQEAGIVKGWGDERNRGVIPDTFT